MCYNRPMTTEPGLFRKIEEICRRQNDIVFADVFGSRASGKVGFASDIDIGVHFSPPAELLRIGELTSELEAILPATVDLVDLNGLPRTHPLLAYNILQNHRLVFSRDDTTYNRFKEESLHHYLDFAHVIEASNRAFEERIGK